MGKGVMRVIAGIAGVMGVIAWVWGCTTGEGPIAGDGSEEVRVPLGAWPVVDKDFSFMWRDGYRQATGKDISFEYTDEVTEVYHNGMSADTVYIGYRGARQSGEECRLYLHGGSEMTFSGEKGKREEDDEGWIEYVSTFRFETGELLPVGGLRLEASVNGGKYEVLPSFVMERVGEVYRYSAAVGLSNVKLRLSVRETVSAEFVMTRLELFSEGLPASSKLLKEEDFRGYGSVEGFPSLYTLDNVVYEPEGDNHHGDNTLVWGLTQGFVGLYPENGPGSITFGSFESVRLAELWFSSDLMEGNHEIWYKEGAGEYKLAGKIVMDQFAGIGKYLRIHFLGMPKEVTFQIRAGHATRRTQFHGYRIWQ
ncbi:MAG: hypothetical protein LBU08_02295 [Tannerellaceae bacterium]|jgi:hypothetical protein|nr:hypothetical protein [Tannerellaceae bacterium]